MENKVYGVIYKITNLVNGKIYVGQTIQGIKARWSQHKFVSKRGDTILCKSIRKHGQDNFIIEIVDYGYSPEELNKLEEKYIQELDSLVPLGYNIKRFNNSCYCWNKEKSSKQSIKRKESSSKYFGVFSNGKGRWKYQIRFLGKKFSIGSFATEEDAAMARDIEIIKDKYQGIFKLNFPELKNDYISGKISIKKYKRESKKTNKQSVRKNKIKPGAMVKICDYVYYSPITEKYSIVINDENGSIICAKTFNDQDLAMDFISNS